MTNLSTPVIATTPAQVADLTTAVLATLPPAAAGYLVRACPARSGTLGQKVIIEVAALDTP